MMTGFLHLCDQMKKRIGITLEYIKFLTLYDLNISNFFIIVINRVLA